MGSKMRRMGIRFPKVSNRKTRFLGHRWWLNQFSSPSRVKTEESKPSRPKCWSSTQVRILLASHSIEDSNISNKTSCINNNSNSREDRCHISLSLQAQTQDPRPKHRLHRISSSWESTLSNKAWHMRNSSKRSRLSSKPMPPS